MKELCAVIYLPADVISAPHTGQQPGGQTNLLQQITANKTYAGNATAAVQPRPPTTPLLIEEEKAQPASNPSSSSSNASSIAGSGSVSSALSDLKGLPVFDRL